MDALRGERVLVTGAPGFIGSHLTRRLVALGAEVHALTPDVSSVFPLRLAAMRDRIILHEGNLADRGAMEALAEAARPRRVFHLAAYTHVAKSWQRVDECIQSNIQGTVNLLQALERTSYERFVYLGSSEIYGGIDVPFREDAAVSPISPYSVAKYGGELFCRIYAQGRGWPIVMVRPFNAYGPAQSPDRVVHEIIVRALRGQPIKMTQGRQTRELNYVEDLVDGLVLLGTADGVDGELFNLGCGEEVSIRQLVATIDDIMGGAVKAEFGALPDRPNEIWRMYSDSSKIRDRLGWKPTHTLEAGLRSTISWYETELARPDSPFAPSW